MSCEFRKILTSEPQIFTSFCLRYLPCRKGEFKGPGALVDAPLLLSLAPSFVSETPGSPGLCLKLVIGIILYA
jgi:hypothetical protein